MYYCKSCNSYFNEPRLQFEHHSLDTEPYEKIYVCPICNSSDYKEINSTHCRCCGAKLKDGEHLYCSDNCEKRGKEMWEKEKRKSNYQKQLPINIILKQLREYNKINNTNLSYGQYVAKLKGAKKKCR